MKSIQMKSIPMKNIRTKSIGMKSIPIIYSNTVVFSTGVFLWVLSNFQEHLFWKSSANVCFWFGYFLHFIRAISNNAVIAPRLPETFRKVKIQININWRILLNPKKAGPTPAVLRERGRERGREGERERETETESEALLFCNF